MKSVNLLFLLVMSVLLLFTVVIADDKPKATAQAETKVILHDSIDIVIDETTLTEQEIEDKIVAYYFHGTRRCVTCKKIESFSQEAIESGFEKELKNGSLEFRPVNFDEEENEHFIKDYELYTKSLVICDYNKGKQIKWKNLEKVWEHVNDKEDFLKYVQDEISIYLNESTTE